MIKPVKIPEGSVLPDYIEEIVLKFGLKGGMIFGIGGFEKAEVGFYDTSTQKYVVREYVSKENRVLEILSFSGFYMLKSDGKVFTHIHVVLGLEHDVLCGGHLIRGFVKPQIEAFFVEVGEDLKQEFKYRDVKHE